MTTTPDDLLEEYGEPDTGRDLLEVCGLTTLADGCDLQDVARCLRALKARLNDRDPLERRTLRGRAVQALKAVKVSDAAGLVDAAGIAGSAARVETLQGQAVTFDDPEAWPDPVDAAAVLGELERTFARYVALPEGAATALAVWTLHAHALDAAAVSPLLVLASPEKRCGKTTTLKVVGALVPRPLPAASISPSALFRGIEKFQPTLLLDEADTAFRDNDELRTLVNAGHDRAGAIALRNAGDWHEPRAFSTWCAKAIALIGTLPGTLTDRAVVIPMRRRRHDETVTPWRVDRSAELEPLRRQAWRWTRDHLDRLRTADPGVPDGLHDRAADNWRPLLAIADAAGGPWPERARRAALVLSGDEDQDDSAGQLLLGDLRALFEENGDRLFTEDILTALRDRDDRPWGEWKNGKPLTSRGLAKLVKRFGITTNQTVKVGKESRKGYQLEWFADAFARYTPAVSVTSVTTRENTGESGDSVSVTTRGLVTDTKTRNPKESGGGDRVTDTEGGNGQGKENQTPETPEEAERRGLADGL